MISSYVFFLIFQNFSTFRKKLKNSKNFEKLKKAYDEIMEPVFENLQKKVDDETMAELKCNH